MDFQGLIVDAMLGRLCRKLRLLGYDAEYHRGSDEEFIRKAVLEKRIPVTRDLGIKNRRIFKEKGIPVIVPDSNDHRKQLMIVLKSLKKLNCVQAKDPRCSICNRILAPIKSISSVSKVPAYVWLHHKEKIRICPECLRAYWKGTHYENFLSEMKKIKGSYENL